MLQQTDEGNVVPQLKRQLLLSPLQKLFPGAAPGAAQEAAWADTGAIIEATNGKVIIEAKPALRMISRLDTPLK